MRKLIGFTLTLAVVVLLAVSFVACGSALANIEKAESLAWNSTKVWCEFEYMNRPLCDQVLGPKSHEVTNQIRVDLQTYEPQLLQAIAAYSAAVTAADMKAQTEAKADMIRIVAILNKDMGIAAENTTLMLAHPEGKKALTDFKSSGSKKGGAP